MVQHLFFGEAELLQAHPQHHLGGDFGQRHAGGLADKGNGSRGPGIDLKDKERLSLDRKLDVHQADNAQFLRHGLGGGGDLGNDGRGQGMGRQHAGRIAGMNARLLDMLHDAADHRHSAIADGIDIDLDRILEKLVKQHRMLAAAHAGDSHEAADALSL